MIAYDELCAQLARWRSKNGMTNGASANPRMREMGAAPAQQYVPPAYSPPPAYAAPPQQTRPSAPQPAQHVASGPHTASGPHASPVSQFTPPTGYGAVPAAYAAQQLSPPAGTQSGGYEPAELPPPDDEPDNLFGSPDPGDMTEIRGQAAPAREDATGEIDIDSIDVVDEEDVP